MYKISVVATLFLSSMWTTVASANLYHAIQNCDVNEVSTSLAAGENPNQLEPYSPPPIFEAVESYQPAPGCTWEKSRAVLRALIKGGANPNLKLSDGRNPLMVLLRYSNHMNDHAGISETAKILIDAGLDVNAVDQNGKSALIFAAETINSPDEIPEVWQVAQLLVGHGADVNVSDHTRNSALIIAAEREHLDLINLLLDHGAHANARDNKGRSPLSYAAYGSKGFLDRSSALLEHGADPNLGDSTGVTPMMYAAAITDAPWMGADIPARISAMALLLKYGADVNAKTLGGESAFTLADDRFFGPITEWLVAHGAVRPY